MDNNNQIDLCRSEPCLNGASCIFMPIENDIRCDCFSGFEGKFCGIETDECFSHPCFSPRVCKDFVGSYEQGFSGVSDLSGYSALRSAAKMFHGSYSAQKSASRTSNGFYSAPISARLFMIIFLR